MTDRLQACIVPAGGTVRDAMQALDAGADQIAWAWTATDAWSGSSPMATCGAPCSAGATLDDLVGPVPESRLRLGPIERGPGGGPRTHAGSADRRDPGPRWRRSAGRPPPPARVPRPGRADDPRRRHGGRPGRAAAAADRDRPEADAPRRRPADPGADDPAPGRVRASPASRSRSTTWATSSRITSRTGRGSAPGSTTCARTSRSARPARWGCCPNRPPSRSC